MKHHHYMKYLFVLLLFLPTSLIAQNKEEKMPGHITKIQKLEDVNVTGNRPHFIRLKGYYRSYQTNNSVMKYFNDGIVEYYINLKNGKTDLNAYSKRNLHNSRLVSEDKKRAFMVSDKGTFRPWPEEKTLIEQYRKKYQLKDSLGTQLIQLNQQTIGSIQTDSSRNICQIEINQLPTYKNLTHQLFGYTQTDIYDHVVEAYQISPEDYYSFKDLLFQKSDNSYLFSHKKDKQQQLIHVITELYITEKEYVEKKQSIKPDSSTPKESAAAITDFCIRNKIPSLPEATEQEMQQWCLRTSAYSQRLLDGLETIQWSDSIKETQKNWIGRSEGTEVVFSVKDSDVKFTIFTTRADTMFGVTFMVLAPESEYVQQVTTAEQKEEIEKYLDYVKKRTELDRMANHSVTGVFSGSYAINPFTGEAIPVWISQTKKIQSQCSSGL